jgi:hypothetical protein
MKFKDIGYSFMRVKVVRTPGELRDSIGHKVIVRKDWMGTVEGELSADEIAEAGFHPKQRERFYSIKFDLWAQPIVLPATLVVSSPTVDDPELEFDGDSDDDE